MNAACEFIRSHMNTSESERSGAYVTGIGMTDILTYLYQDEDALVAAMLYRSARKSIISLADIEKNSVQTYRPSSKIPWQWVSCLRLLKAISV